SVPTVFGSDSSTPRFAVQRPKERNRISLPLSSVVPRWPVTFIDVAAVWATKVRMRGTLSNAQDPSTCFAADRTEGCPDGRDSHEHGPTNDQRQDGQRNGGEENNRHVTNNLPEAHRDGQLRDELVYGGRRAGWRSRAQINAPQVFGRGLGGRHIDHEAGAELKTRRDGQLRKNLKVPVIIHVPILVNRRGVDVEVIGRVVQAVKDSRGQVVQRAREVSLL